MLKTESAEEADGNVIIPAGIVVSKSKIDFFIYLKSWSQLKSHRFYKGIPSSL